MTTPDVITPASNGQTFVPFTKESTNGLLNSLPPEDYGRIALHLKQRPMKLKQVLQKQGEPYTHVFFPGGGACSLVKTLEDGHAAEIGMVGAEGVVGASVFFGQRIAECDVIVQVPGPQVTAMTVEDFNSEMQERGAFYNRVVRYNQALLSQIMQTTVCNGLHSAEQRCCRWLLTTHDRTAGGEFPLTHETLAAMLGVRRPTVTLVANSLQAAGLIQYRRGAVTIVNRDGLEGASCECYRTVKTIFARLLPEVNTATVMRPAPAS